MLDGVQFVVSNFELQGIHGIDFLLRAKQRTPGLKFALFTGHEYKEGRNDELEFIITHLFYTKTQPPYKI